MKNLVISDVAAMKIKTTGITKFADSCRTPSFHPRIIRALFCTTFILACTASVTRAQLILDRDQIIQTAIQKKWTLLGTTQNQKAFELQVIRNNIPQYYITNNINAADTVSTDECWLGGTLGLDLSGLGVTLGIWDAGRVRPGHTEFTGRVTQRDGLPALHFHSTHVAGTMIGAGVYPGATPQRTRGMSFKAELDAYDWNNDENEMANAASNGLLVSNHSYGFIVGWEFGNFGAGEGWYWFGDTTVDNFEDFAFGFYSFQARSWDSILHQFPSYLIVTSAGNDRNDSGPGTGAQHYVISNGNWILSNAARSRDGNNGYDSLAHASGAKNVLSIGSVLDILGGYTSPANVLSSSFSAWGPTDDGRIKPDLVANGSSLLSAAENNNTDYITLSGTSMSSPSVAGSLGILIQHYRDTHNQEDMLAATLKGVAIHTADEAGSNPGPDYRFGWGLMNTLRAAEHITLDLNQPGAIQELTLFQNQSVDETWPYTGSGPIWATISWTDPPGTSPNASLDPPDKMLVNDLDLVIIGPDSTIYTAWILDPTLPLSPATTGDNNTDNVEKVRIDLPGPGDYTFRITHKGNLVGNSGGTLQDFSLCISGVDVTGDFPGACCDGNLCTGTMVRDDCTATGGTWYGGADCSGFTCPAIGACCEGCSPSTTCSEMTLSECLSNSGVWQEGFTCGQTDCSLPGDDCVTDIQVVTDGTYNFNNTCASTDGPATVACASGNEEFGKDLWYSYTATCSGMMTVSLCSGTTYDAIMVVYSDDSAVCPCPVNSSSQLGLCEDDSCGTGGGPPTLERFVNQGQCYTIRIAGWQGDSGKGLIDIVCDPIETPDPLLPDSSGPGGFVCETGSQQGVLCSTCNGGTRDQEYCFIESDCPSGSCAPSASLCLDGSCSLPAPYRKSRFISMMAPDTTSGRQPAIRITFVDVPEFPESNGSVKWVGSPLSYRDTAASDIEFTASLIQCGPNFTDWTQAIPTVDGQSVRPIEVIHVYGRDVVPGSIYQAQLVYSDCPNWQTSELCYSEPLTIDTAKWGDIVFPLSPGTSSSQPDISDVLATVNKWLGSLEPAKVRSLMEPDFLMPNVSVSIADILRVVDAWLGVPYPFGGPVACP